MNIYKLKAKKDKSQSRRRGQRLNDGGSSQLKQWGVGIKRHKSMTWCSVRSHFVLTAIVTAQTNCCFKIKKECDRFVIGLGRWRALSMSPSSSSHSLNDSFVHFLFIDLAVLNCCRMLKLEFSHWNFVRARMQSAPTAASSSSSSSSTGLN